MYLKIFLKVVVLGNRVRNVRNVGNLREEEENLNVAEEKERVEKDVNKNHNII